MNNLDLNKAHGHNMLSLRMMKWCRNSYWKPLSIVFNDCLKERKYLSDWTKVVSVHKKGEKQCLRNYRPISLLRICSKIFER